MTNQVEKLKWVIGTWRENWKRKNGNEEFYVAREKVKAFVCFQSMETTELKDTVYKNMVLETSWYKNIKTRTSIFLFDFLLNLEYLFKKLQRLLHFSERYVVLFYNFELVQLNTTKILPRRDGGWNRETQKPTLWDNRQKLADIMQVMFPCALFSIQFDPYAVLRISL